MESAPKKDKLSKKPEEDTQGADNGNDDTGKEIKSGDLPDELE